MDDLKVMIYGTLGALAVIPFVIVILALIFHFSGRVVP